MTVQNKKIIVAIDGYSSCGKSTMAKSLARAIGYIYVDTGAMYRGVTWAALRAGILDDRHLDIEALEQLVHSINLQFELNAEGVPELYLDGICVEQDIRSMYVSSFVSRVAAEPCVREALTHMQQRMGQNRGIVMDGRDIGTTVFPHAELKIFVTAEPRIRAERRLAELRAKGDNATSLEEVLHNVKNRDYQDSHREIAPLRQAKDAIVLDNSYLSREEQHSRLIALFNETLNKCEK